MRTNHTSCCFTGHRPAKLPWHYQESDPQCLALKRRIAAVLEVLYQNEYRHFICGMALGCDHYFCECALALRTSHPDITVEAAVPCPEQASRWSQEQQTRYARLLDACDFQTMVSPQYTPFCMQKRDRYMVDRASLLVAVFDGSSGGTQYTIAYALQKGLSIVDIPVTVGGTPRFADWISSLETP